MASIMRSKFILTLFLLLILPVSLFSNVGDWVTFTNQGDIRDFVLQDDFIWCATNGGVFRYEISTNSYLQFYNTNGLTSLDAQAIEIDQDGNIWVGYADGWLNCYLSESNTWDYINDYFGHAINDLKSSGDSLLVALDIGISLYDIKRKEVKETYKNLGWQIPVEIPVLNIFIKDREIWACTEHGVARSSFDLANLMAPESWTNYTSAHGLLSDEITMIISHNDTIFAATPNGISYLKENYWYSVNQGLTSLGIKSLNSKDGFLYALSSGNIFSWDASSQSWELISPHLYGLTIFSAISDSSFWVGRKKSETSRGLALFTSTTQQWQEYFAPGPPGNEITCLTIDQNGILWCGSTTDGIFRYDENAASEKWKQFTKTHGLLTNRIETITVDSQNRKWVATTGGGVSIVEEQDSLVTITNIYTEVLSGISTDPNFVVITDVKIDPYNNIWMLNLAAANNNAVAVYSSQLQWQFFTMQEGILNSAVRALTFDRFDRVWVGSDGGVNVIDYNNTLMDKNDDDFSGTLTTADGLESNHVKDLAIDLDDIAWIATESGLNYWMGGSVYYQTGLLSNTINTIEIDVRNNKWFGTTAGVNMLAPDGYTWEYYNTDNSPIVSDNITALAFDQESGRVYIGTTNGISCLETAFSRPRENLDQVKAGPNPFILRSGQNFTISNLADDVSIKFMTENGMVVREISKDNILGAQAEWDGQDDSGNSVASGIYLFVIFNEETGLNRVGKVAVIN